MTGKVSARAPAKFILTGEHFVVTGVPGLALPVRELCCTVEAEPHPQLEVHFEIPSAREPMDRAVKLAADLMRIDLKASPLRVESKVNFPILRGLGSSAAFSVALARALEKAAGTDSADIPRVVGALETLFHGKPSGIDAAAILTGTPIRFRKGEPDEVTPFRNLLADFVIVDTGERKDTASLVQKVRDFRERRPERWDIFCTETREITERAFRAFQGAPDAWNDLVKAVTRNGEILAELDLLPDRAAEILEFARHVGASAGKISGAGQGGAMVLVALPGTGERLKETLSTRGIPVLAVEKAFDHGNIPQ